MMAKPTYVVHTHPGHAPGGIVLGNGKWIEDSILTNPQELVMGYDEKETVRVARNLSEHNEKEIVKAEGNPSEYNEKEIVTTSASYKGGKTRKYYLTYDGKQFHLTQDVDAHFPATVKIITTIVAANGITVKII